MSYAEEYDRLRYLRRLGIITDLEAEALLAPYVTLNFNYAGIERKLMSNFKEGDEVRLKDSPYKGKVELHAGSYIRFRMADGSQVTVSDYKMLTRDIDPKPGDIYEDKNGNEWVIIKQKGWSHQPEEYLIARCIDSFTYPHNTLLLNKPENVIGWADQYEPKPVRRRGA